MSKPDPLIPRATLLRNPDRAAIQISPLGQWLTFLGDDRGLLNIWIAPISDPESPQPLLTSGGVHSYQWSLDDRYILFPRDVQGDENYHIYTLEIASRTLRDLTPFPNISARIAHLAPNTPGRALLSINRRQAALHDLYEANLETGELSLVEENQGYLRFIADSRNNVRFAVRMTPDGGSEYLQRLAGSDWEVFLTISPEDQLTTSVEGFDHASAGIYLRDSRGRNTSALTLYDPRTKQCTVMAEDSGADLGATLFHPSTGKLQAVTFCRERARWVFFDHQTERAHGRIQGAAPRADLSVVSRTLNDSHWIVGAIHDDSPAKSFLYEHATGNMRFLFENFQPRDSLGFENLPLTQTQPVEIRSRDGLSLVCYLHLPRWTAPKPDQPLPLILLVHGGPWSRDIWGLNPSAQWLANRGYAALSVNFRGSSGFGKSFLNAGNREWGRRMQDDLVDAADWAVGQGIADPSRIAIMGSSYGGYAALAGLTFTPHRFACAVDICGPSNLVTFLNSTPAYWKPLADLMTTRVGDPASDDGRRMLLDRSPLEHVSDIHRPLLIVHGANDPRVPLAESDRMAEALAAAGVPVVYVVFLDEGHGISKPVNAHAFAAIAEAFLARFLGGRFEPSQSASAPESMEIRLGSELLG